MRHGTPYRRETWSRLSLEQMYESKIAITPAYALTYLKVRCKGVGHYYGWLGIAEDDDVCAAMGYQNAAGGKDFLHQSRQPLEDSLLQSPHPQS